MTNARALVQPPSLLEAQVMVTNPNSSCSLQKSGDKPHLPPPSLGKTVLMVWAVGLGAWDHHIGCSLIPKFWAEQVT